MMKRFILILCALFLLCGMDVTAASDSKNKKSTRQKERRSRKAKEQKAQRELLKLRRSFQDIHKLQEKLLDARHDAAAAKEYAAKIEAVLKKLAPQLKTLGALPGIKVMSNIEELLKEGKKLQKDPEGISEQTMLETLQSKQLEMIDKLRNEKK